MCGIAGYWGANAQTRAAWMTRLLAHRGPDDEGVAAVAGQPLALGNRRLKILDLSEQGHQPMTGRSGSVLTFNGEIFNHRALRSELESRGHSFRSHSDTEVLLGALEEWGPGALARLNGMFAFAYWDAQTARLLIARDRLGIKPLYYASSGSELAFSSEVRSLLASELVRPELDRSKLASYLRLLWLPEPDTLFRRILKLEPGTYGVWDGTSMEVTQYWDVPRPISEASTVSTAEETRELLQAAVERQLVADVPVGAFLSGGIDSATIVALAAKAGQGRVKTYSIGFSTRDRRHDGALDDLTYARLMASHIGAEHQEIILEPRVTDLLPMMVRHLEDPIADPAAINAYLICEAARATSTVLLSGTGGDELFGGYNKYVGTLLGERYQRLPKGVRTHVVEPVARLLPVTIGHTGLRAVRRAKRFLQHGGRSTFERFMGYSTYYDAPELQSLLSLEGPANPDLGIESMRSAWDRRDTGDVVDRMTYLDLKYYLPGLGLAYMDKASMAASVEVRVPLLDDDLVEFVARLPGRCKLQGPKTKIALREAVRGLVPDAILARPKAPFIAPVRAWLRGDLSAMVDDLLSPARVRARGLLDPGAVSKQVADHRAGWEDHSLRIWAFLTLEIWMQEFIDGAASWKAEATSLDSFAVTGGADAASRV